MWDPEAGQCYYFNTNTESVQWDPPTKGAQFGAAFRKRRFKFLHLLAHAMPPVMMSHRSEGGGGEGGDDDGGGGHGEGGGGGGGGGNASTTTTSLRVVELTIRRERLVQDSFLRVRQLGPEELRSKTRVSYVGEPGIDSGGLTKDWFLELPRHLLDPSYCLFRGNVQGDFYVDKRSGVNEDHLDYFEFLGLLLGKAMHDRQLVDTPFAPMVYKYLLGHNVTISDMESIDKVHCRSLRWMLDNPITGVVDETFSIAVEEFGETKQVELVPGGVEVAVTETNKAQYVKNVVAYHTTGSVGAQLKHFKRGFNRLVPAETLAGVSHADLHLLLNGRDEVDTETIRTNARYLGGYDADALPVRFFWEAFEAMSAVQRRSLLKFTTGSSRMPFEGLEPAFAITKSQHGEAALPSSHTCFNNLVLPPYSNLPQMVRKLLTATMVHGEGFHMT